MVKRRFNGLPGVGCGFAVLAVIAVASLPHQAVAIQHGCTPPTGDITDIVVDVSLGGRRSQVAGPFCEAIRKSEALIARSSLAEERKRAAYQTLAQLQDLVARQGRSAAGGKVQGSFGCKGTVSTGQGGTTATGSCGFQINF